MRFPQYKIGAKWKTHDGEGIFTIIGLGSKSDRKLCRYNSAYYDQRGIIIEQEYTHKHLKRYAKPETT